MSIITRYLSIVTEPQFKLARDLTAMAIADGKITKEEKEALITLCHLEDISETHLMERLQGEYEDMDAETPKEHCEKVAYLRQLIKLIGADKHVAPQEIYLFQIIAGRMGLTQMEVTGLFLMTATRRCFEGDVGTKVFASFLKNHIDPKGKTEKDNRQNLRTIYDTVACNTERLQDPEADTELLRQNLIKATETFMQNTILMKEFKDMNLDFEKMLKEEANNVFMKYK